MKKTALFIDFEDSFSFNVVQELEEVGLIVEVIKWDKFNLDHKADLLVLGPGPGHPDEYQNIFPLIENWLALGGKIFAICLGHQILWRMRGENVERSLHPLHGQKIKLKINQDWQKWLNLPSNVSVQRYNSLAVKAKNYPGIENHLEDGEIMISRGSNVISYQFHPESVGTNCRDSFFRVIFSNLL